MILDLRKKLGLEEWAGEVIVSNEELSCVVFDRKKKRFTIIINLKDYIEDGLATLIHEFLHIKYPDLPENEIENKTQELLLELTSKKDF